MAKQKEGGKKLEKKLATKTPKEKKAVKALKKIEKNNPSKLIL